MIILQYLVSKYKSLLWVFSRFCMGRHFKSECAFLRTCARGCYNMINYNKSKCQNKWVFAGLGAYFCDRL
uniref:Uncharacterized protein n=1 Tax=Anguilla anguilla TaxID=7936 RepID=A0A0E9RXU6_ANGAN